MHRFARLPAAALALAALAAPALAQDRPQLQPTRDATIDYRLEGHNTPSGQPRTMRMFVTAGGGKTRIEPSEGRTVIILDRGASKMTIVMLDKQQYMERPMNPSQQAHFDVANGTKFTRRGSETIAGQRCTVWESQGERHGSGCVTDTGLVLKGESTSQNGEHSVLLATAVSLGSLSADLFQPPPGFSRMAIPQMPGGMPGGMPNGIPGRPGMPGMPNLPPGVQLPPGVTLPRP